MYTLKFVTPNYGLTQFLPPLIESVYMAMTIHSEVYVRPYFFEKVDDQKYFITKTTRMGQDLLN